VTLIVNNAAVPSGTKPVSIRVNIPWFLRHLAGGVETVLVEGSTAGECLEHLTKQFPALRDRLFDTKTGKLLYSVDIYVNRESSYPELLDRPAADGDEIDIMFIIAGG